ncbi:MAG TPA: 4a-hydroxytetrahydrobiopterin dehydratase [Candidatus Binatia bacterium]|nr:4a-hydroxytetrahydrobiopterin dehydratase [Candidatus Binatia bacterium]
MKPQLSHAEIVEKLQKRPGWHHRGNSLERTYDRGDFNGSVAFVNAIAEAANAMDHHPDIEISWNEVKLILCTHEAGGLTDRDFALAERIDRLAV